MTTGINYLDEVWNPINRVNFHPERLDKPLRWRKPRRVGVCFTGDWMDDQVRCEWVDQILEIVTACPQHQFFSLTKQPQNLEDKIYGHDSPARELGGGDYLPNLWNGISITDQDDADRMIPELLQIPGKHWVSIEPQLSEIDLHKYLYVDRNGGWEYWGAPNCFISLVVLGAESGPRRCPCPHEWMISIVEQCRVARVPVWVKQIDLDGRVCHDISRFPKELQVRQWPESAISWA